MSENIEKKIKYCVYCGAEVPENETYCPKCGKLIIKIDSNKKDLRPPIGQKLDISRKCPGCGSIITSKVIDQCPICDTPLEKISDVKKELIQKQPGLIFMEKKLEPEQKFILKKDLWNLKEGFNVFLNCVYILIIIYFLLSFSLYQTGINTENINIQQILLVQIPELLFAVYPIFYIYSKKHSFTKIGFYPNSKKNLLAVFIGILGAILLIEINYFSDSLINFFSDIGLDFFDASSSIGDQNMIIRNAGLLWIVLLIITLSIGAFSTEIVYRGVLHNTLKQKFKNDFSVILLVALIYSSLMLLITFPIGFSFFLINFLASVLLGIIFELSDGNIISTIFANIFYNIGIIILVYLNF